MENMPEIDVEKLKNDPQFLENIQRLEQECRDEQSIAKGYQMLDAKLVIEAPEEEINEIFTFIVNSAFDKLAENLTTVKSFDMQEAEDIATTRAIYEHAMQRYSENDKKGAKEMFLVLHYTMNQKDLKDAMMVHACAVMAGKSFEDFVETMVDTENVDMYSPLAFFIQNFTQPTDILLTMFAKYVKQGEDELKVLDS